MWLWMAIGSALFLGFYDIAKKQALKRNDVMQVLFAVSLFSTVLLIPFFSKGSVHDCLILLPKAALVTVSWISGLIGIKLLPLTTASTIKASRPIFVVIFSIFLFGERLNLCQWAGVLTAFAALFLLSVSSRREGIFFSRNKGIAWMVLSVITGVSSALYDKYAINILDPMFVQCWCNLFITVMMGVVLAVKTLLDRSPHRKFHWDWTLLAVSVLIVVSDAMYFYSISIDGALLSVISLLRRCSVAVTFAFGAIIFKEKNIRAKSFDLALLLIGMGMLLLGSSL